MADQVKINTQFQDAQNVNQERLQVEDQLSKPKKNYSKINKTLRQEIIREILTEKRSIHEVAQEYDLLPSTCKSIVNTFLKEGRIGKKERRIRKLKKITTVYNIVINPLNPSESSITTTSSVEDITEPSIKSKKAKTQNSEQIQLESDQDVSAKTIQYLQNWLQQYEIQFKALQQLQQLEHIKKNQDHFQMISNFYPPQTKQE